MIFRYDRAHDHALTVQEPDEQAAGTAQSPIPSGFPSAPEILRKDRKNFLPVSS